MCISVFGHQLHTVCYTRKEDNYFDKHAVAILKDGFIVRHLPNEFHRIASFRGSNRSSS